MNKNRRKDTLIIIKKVNYLLEYCKNDTEEDSSIFVVNEIKNIINYTTILMKEEYQAKERDKNGPYNSSLINNVNLLSETIDYLCKALEIYKVEFDETKIIEFLEEIVELLEEVIL